MTAARLIAESKQNVAKGDDETNYIPQLSFFAQYNRNTTILNNINSYFNNSRLTISFPDSLSAFRSSTWAIGPRDTNPPPTRCGRRSKPRRPAAERTADCELNASLRELDAQAEVASLKQQIAADNVKTVQTELENGNGAGGAPGAPAQVAPKPASWRKSTSGKSTKMRRRLGWSWTRRDWNCCGRWGTSRTGSTK